mgnify:CR=1 FL=1
MSNVKLDRQTIEEVLTEGKNLETDFSKLRQNYAKYKQMYFMEPSSKPRNNSVDKNDWKITPSPSVRNEVQGAKRLVDTSELHVDVVEGTQSSKNSDKIERALKKIVDESAKGTKSRIVSDASLETNLYGPVILFAEFMQDKVTAAKSGSVKPYMLAHLEDQAKNTPAKIKVLNAEECSFTHADGLCIMFQRKYILKGSQIKAQYGEVAGKPIKSTNDYTVRDIFTPEYRIVNVEGYETVMAMEHKLGCIPVGIGYSGGSELFYKPEEQINPFLYAKMKAELWERETSAYTTIFTSLNMRGLLGPMHYIEGNVEKINIDYKGGARFMTTQGGGKAQMIDDKIVDPVVFDVLKLIDDLSGQSTIYRQTLGENIGAGTFSGLAMLSSAGKLPLVDSTRALEQAFSEIFDIILYRIKEDGMDHPVLKASDIPERYELKVTFKPDLPQDELRNSQIASTLKGLVSDEWIQTKTLGIGDSSAMRKQIFKEQVYTAIMAKMASPESPYIDQLVQMMLGQGQPPQQGQPTPPTGQPNPNQQTPPDMTQQGQQQGIGQGQPPVPGQPGQPNVEAMPQTDAVVPPAQRM